MIRQAFYGRFCTYAFVILTISIYFYLNFPVIDDALIIQRYIYNFINGSGLYFNNGEHYYGYTAIFPTWINTAIASFFGLDMHTLRFMLPSACLLVIMEMLYKFVFEKKLVATLLAVLNPIFIYYLYSGLESYHIIFFTLIFVRQITLNQWGSLTFLTPLAPFFRPELIFISIPIFIFSLLQIEKNKVILFTYSLIIPVITLFIIFLSYDNIVPLSITAKIQNQMELVTFLRISIIQTIGFYNNNFLQFTVYIVTITIAIYAIFLSRKHGNKFLVGITIIVIGYSIYLLLSRAYYPWYFSPISLLISILWIYTCIKVDLKISVFLYFIFLSLLGSQINYVLDRNAYVERFYVELLGTVSEKVKAYNRAGSTVIVGSSGYVGVELTDYVVRDMIGLDTPEIIDIRRESKTENELLCAVDWQFLIIRNDPREIPCLVFDIIDTVPSDIFGSFYIVQR